jgi:Fe-S oxidoreductase
VLFPDTLTNHLDPGVAQAAVFVLEQLGLQVDVPERPVCCGLTWLSTGQLGVARRALARTAAVLRPWLDDGVPVVGLEPSCTALLKGDAEGLLPHDDSALRLMRSVRTFAEVLGAHMPEAEMPESEMPESEMPESEMPGRGAAALGATPPGLRAVVQVHCHQHAEIGFDADEDVLRRLDVEAQVLDSGCCGLAGSFGYERGHYGISMACAERVLLPAVRAADASTTVLADGFSCRLQIRHATGVEPLHLAQLADRIFAAKAPPRR